jgi:hypothetical protein
VKIQYAGTIRAALCMKNSPGVNGLWEAEVKMTKPLITKKISTPIDPYSAMIFDTSLLFP